MKLISALVLGTTLLTSAFAANAAGTYVVVSAVRCEQHTIGYINSVLAVTAKLVNPSDASTLGDLEESDEEGKLVAKLKSSRDGRALRITATYQLNGSGETISADGAFDTGSSGRVAGNKCDGPEDVNKTFIEIGVRHQR